MLVSPSQPFSKPRRTKHVQLYFATTSTQLPDEPKKELRRLSGKTGASRQLENDLKRLVQEAETGLSETRAISERFQATVGGPSRQVAQLVPGSYYENVSLRFMPVPPFPRHIDTSMVMWMADKVKQEETAVPQDGHTMLGAADRDRDGSPGAGTRAGGTRIGDKRL